MVTAFALTLLLLTEFPASAFGGLHFYVNFVVFLSELVRCGKIETAFLSLFFLFVDAFFGCLDLPFYKEMVRRVDMGEIFDIFCASEKMSRSFFPSSS